MSIGAILLKTPWTKDIPTMEGYYWIYQENDIEPPSPQIVLVFLWNNVFQAKCFSDSDGWELKTFAKKFADYWMGPIDIPEPLK